METTRHFTASVYVVNDGAIALHDHKRLPLWLPPGGHLDRDELPHEAALREAREETGLELSLVADPDDITAGKVRSIPRPRHVQLADINECDGEVGHQHVDLIFYARATSRAIDPVADDEVDPDDWEWFAPDELAGDDRIEPDVAEIGRRAVETVEGSTSGAASTAGAGTDD